MPTPPPDATAPRNPDYTLPDEIRGFLKSTGLVTRAQLDHIAKSLFDEIAAELRSGHGVTVPYLGNILPKPQTGRTTKSKWVKPNNIGIAPNGWAIYAWRHPIYVTWHPLQSYFAHRLEDT